MQKLPGTLFIVAAPSGGGKTSLVNDLISKINNIEISISHTTRPKRAGEEHGKDYFFIDEKEFKDLIKKGEFVEYAHVFNYYYATSWTQIKNRLACGIDVVLDIDWQGAQQIKQRFSNTISIFIIPPSLDSLNERLLKRQRDGIDIISDRMEKAQDELKHYNEFNYLIVNDNFEKASIELQAIVIANRLQLEKQEYNQQKLLSLLLVKQ